MALFDQLFKPLLDAIKKALGPFGRLFDLLSKFWTKLSTFIPKTTRLVQGIIAEVAAWRQFKEDIRYRTSVINIPAAVEATRSLIEQIARARDAIVDLWNELKGKLEPAGNPTEEAEQAIQDIENAGFRDILQKFPKLLKGAEKVLGFVAIIADALESLISAVDDLQAILDVISSLREEVEHGSTVFLQQKNKRRVVTLEDGTKMRIRVGSLH